MPLLNTLTTPYAEAFLQVADQRGETEEVVTQAKELLNLWRETPSLREALASPVIEVEAKKDVLVKLFADQITPSFLNLLKLLTDRSRIGILDAVLERLLDLYREQRHIALATVTSATPLSDEQQVLLSKRVQAVAGTDKVEIKLLVDPALIGGFIVRLGSQVIDASLSGQVRRLGLELARVS
ncbi:ATP synthase F1 subunit delta [Cyanobium sp. Morenito 9A2]|uniref:ATP synthase F1 subunit delta n=1 Tax=Cyanobium sp. Morenito 9A2 TaxID=2823718 RepID=UPI0020CD8FE8|nr:ATP synthase F1 subunit delta [Cyanobium sp. Morenito 9A2]MCP9849139.1 F0F1 ATP synthase subunit delta [Cyanobium sp. Morenito 9A2]